jgi:hypothetical protein
MSRAIAPASMVTSCCIDCFSMMTILMNTPLGWFATAM